MLQSLSIKNYALIDNLNIEFNKGFTIITGETGAGKSILLGALSLLVGQRADTSVLFDKSQKCIVEGVLDITGYNLADFFSLNEIDYTNQAIIRREILDNGRSRAFVNDTPVNLNILKELGDKLIDIHSQHQSLYLNDYQFQLKVIDTLAKNVEIFTAYKNAFKTCHKLQAKYNELLEKSQQEKNELDFMQHQFNELDMAKLKENEQVELEEELEVLSHAEEIKTYLSQAASLFHAEQTGIVYQLKDASGSLNKIKQVYHKALTLLQRIDSAYIEIKDIASETELLAESIELDPDRLDWVKKRLDTIYMLCQKHRVNNENELIEVTNTLDEKIRSIQSYDEELLSLKKVLDEEKARLKTFSEQLSQSRQKVIPSIEEQITGLLRQLGMQNAVFSVNNEKALQYQPTGVDKITFLFTANKQVELQDISKIASGGEISRLMLALKSVIASSLAMPTVIFDEIDTGVSGDIADKMANIMKQMSAGMQVVSITHLPQVAAKGEFHYLVYKVEGDTATSTKIKQLHNSERVTEIAKMLSGEQLTEAALNNARELLNN
jgi:DNA repair protein RecN (Recombination protein N)